MFDIHVVPTSLLPLKQNKMSKDLILRDNIIKTKQHFYIKS